MKKNKSFFKKAQAVVLVLAMIVSLAFPLQGMQVMAEANTTEATTDGKIVAQNYELSAAEKELISSGLLVGNSHTYLVPDSDDGLITVDTDNKEITVGNYEGTAGYLWKAESVDIVVGTEVKETVSLIDGKGTYTYAGNAFSVIAKFALDLNVDTAIQSVLLNAPKDLADGLSNLADIAKLKNDLAIIEKAMPTMVELATTGVKIEISGWPVTITFNTEKANVATLALNNQMTANGNVLDLSVMISEYEAAASKTKYLVENGAAIKAKAEELSAQLNDILTASFWTLIDSIDGADDYSAIFILRSALQGAAADLAALCEKDWLALEKTIVKDGLSEVEYAAIDTLLSQVIEPTNVLGLEIKNPLRVATTTVQHNMSMFDVSVKVALNLTDATSTDVKYYEYGSKTTTVTLAEGATKAEILEAVLASGIEADAKASWGTAFVDGKFTAVKSELPDTLNADAEYVITYNPNLYDVTFGYGSLGTVSYPYGYVLKLESHVEDLKAYDYTINGEYYAQGSSYKVVDAANIDRKEGKSYISSNLYQIVADNYLTGKGAAILTSGALLGDELVAVRYPDNSNGIVTLSGKTLNAADFVASYKGLSWKPYSYTLSNGNTYLFNGANTVEITEDFETATVTYRLYLTNFDNGAVIDITNIPSMLDEEAKAQLAAFDVIAAQKGNLETLNRTMVNILAGLIENTTLSDDATKEAALKENFTSVLNSIQAECMGATNLYLYDMANEYSVASDKLLYYYNNNEGIRNEVAKLAGYMTELLGEGGTLTAADKLAALEKLMRSLPSNIVSADKVEEYVGKLTNLETSMNNVANDLSAPNAIINLDSNKLGALTAALQSEGETAEFTALSDGLHLEDSTIVVVASNKTAITVTMQIEGGKNTTIASATVKNDVVLDEAFVNAIKDAIKAELAAQSIDAKYYNTTYAEEVFDALVGTLAGDVTETAYEFVWTYKSFDVSVPGTETQTLNIKNKVITLPASNDAAYRYDYYINGVLVNATSYALSDAEFDMLANGTFTVTKEEVFVLREDLVDYVNSLNEAIDGDQAVFALVEGTDGKFSIVLKIDASAPKGLTGAVQGVAMGIVQGSYPYVGIDDNKFLAEGSVYLQALVDALLNSGFGTDAMLNIVDRNGNINNMPALDGNIISNVALDTMGGKLMKTTIQLGTNEVDATNVPFYVTLGAVNDDFVAVRNLFEDKLNSLVTFTCEDGAASVSLNLPDKLYEACLAALLVTNNISLDDMNVVDGKIAADFINNMFIPLFKSDISVKTFDNTLAKFDINLDLASTRGAEVLFSKLKAFYTQATFTYDEIGASTTANLGISSIIDSMNVGPLGNIIAEKETGLDITMRMAVEDLAKDYEALYLDTNAEGIINKVGLTEDLDKKAAEIEGACGIVLLKDVDADLTFNGISVLNLNGYKVNGDITANAKTVIIDSNIQTTRTGGVTGNVSGKAIIVAGKYDQDVTDYIKSGFVQDEDGVVVNQYYSMAQTPEGNVNVSISADIISATEMPNIAALGVDLACDLLFNGYTASYLELDGNLIYNISLKDLVTLYASNNRVDTVIESVFQMIDSAELTTFVNTVIDDVTDFAAISNAIDNNEPILEYQMVTKPWSVEFAHVEDGDYITTGIVPGDNAEDVTLNLFVGGSEEDKALVSDIFAELGETVTTDIEVNFSHLKDGKDLKFAASASADIRIDWTNPNYAVMFGVIIADGLNPAEREGLVNGIRTYYETGDMTEFKNAFNALKNSQLIEAVKKVNRGDKFTDMVKALGLEDVVTSEVAQLEALYDRIGKAIAFVVRKVDLEGGNRTLGSFIDPDGSYGVSRGNMEKLLKKALFRGYTAEADIAIEKAILKINLFADNAPLDPPKFVDGHGNPTILPSDKIVGSKIDLTEKLMIIDTQVAGITVGEFKSLVKFEAENADTIDIVIGDGTLADSDLLPNGAKITATASREGTDEIDVVSYDIIVLGDINCNGRIEAGDAVLISRQLVGEMSFNKVQTLAADTNCNARTDIGDATRIASKIVDWDNYRTMLGIDNV